MVQFYFQDSAARVLLFIHSRNTLRASFRPKTFTHRISVGISSFIFMTVSMSLRTLVNLLMIHEHQQLGVTILPGYVTCVLEERETYILTYIT